MVFNVFLPIKSTEFIFMLLSVILIFMKFIMVKTIIFHVFMVFLIIFMYLIIITIYPKLAIEFIRFLALSAITLVAITIIHHFKFPMLSYFIVRNLIH